MKNKKWIIITIVLIIFFLGCFFIIKNNYQKNYAEILWNRLSKGDVSSVECQKAKEKYVINNPLNGTNNYENFYSFKKKRCLSMSSQNFEKNENGIINGHTDKIFDLITNDTLVSCTVNYFPKATVFCNDNQNNWNADNESKITPPPFPIYSKTWIPLNKLGVE